MKLRTRKGDVIDIENIQRMNLKPGEKILVTIDVGNLPPTQAGEYMDAVLMNLQVRFPDNEVFVVSSKVTITAIP
jgi:hypothetical protein